MNSRRKTRVVVILAVSRSGSHLLSQLLGAHSRCVSIGELHNYGKFLNRTGSGNVTAGYADDPLFRGLADAPVRCWHERILANAQRQQPGVTTLIDNSKRAGWLRRLLGVPNLEVIPLHLLRDPRALVRHWQNHYDSARKLRRQRVRLARLAPLQAPALLTCGPTELFVRKWLIRNREITRLLEKAGHSENLVSYHDLATRTEETLTRLMPLLGLSFEPEQLRFGDAQHHGTMKTAYRQANERSEIRLDVRWQSELHPEQARAMVNDPRIRRYLARRGLALASGGLTRNR